MGKKIFSTTKKAKGIIRREIQGRYGPKAYGGGKSTLANMKVNADAYNAGMHGSKRLSDYTKGAGLVDGGCFRCYYDDQREFLAKIYGKKRVQGWANDKVHNTYKHLIGREYSAMLTEQKNKKRK